MEKGNNIDKTLYLNMKSYVVVKTHSHTRAAVHIRPPISHSHINDNNNPLFISPALFSYAYDIREGIEKFFNILHNINRAKFPSPFSQKKQPAHESLHPWWEHPISISTLHAFLSYIRNASSRLLLFSDLWQCLRTDIRLSSVKTGPHALVPLPYSTST